MTHRPLRPCGVCSALFPDGDCPTHPKKGGYRPDRPSVASGAYGRLWQRVRGLALARDGGRCVYCLGAGNTGDHVTPLSRGGVTELDNVVCACGTCNTAKGDRTLQEWVRAGNVPMPALQLLARRIIEQLPV